MRNKIEYIVGMLILTLGICLIVIANVGVSPWDSVSLGFVQIYGLNLGQWTFIVGIILVLLTSLINSPSIRMGVINKILSSFFFLLLIVTFLIATNSIMFLLPLFLAVIVYVYLAIKNNLKIRYTSIVAGLLTGVLIEMWLKLIGEYIPSGITTCIIGIAVLSLGIATYTRVNIAPNPIDNFMVALIHAFDFTITKAKLITDIIGISIGMIIGGPIGIGTLLIVGLTGPLVGIFNNFYNHLDRKKL
jgi:uncharacterized membrane protein YczE